MRILYVTLGALPAVAWGGPVKIVHQNALEMLRRGHSVTVCATNLRDKGSKISPGNSEATVEGIRTVYLSTLHASRWPGTLGPTLLTPTALNRLWTEVRHADVVHLNGVRNAPVITGALYARLMGKPVVLQPHGTIPRIVSSLWLKRVYDLIALRQILRASTLFVAAQVSERAQILAAGGDASAIRIVPNGLPPSRSAGDPSGFRERHGLPEDRAIVLFLARINRKKGTDVLVEAFARLHASTLDRAHLVIAGADDGQLSEVQSLIARHRLQARVTLTGLLNRSQAQEALAAADLFVLPCRVDTFPMALVEACQSGVPIVVTDTCEIADQLAGRAALVVPFDTDEVARAIARLVEDQGLRDQLGRGGRALVESEFSIEAVGDRLEAIYQEILRPREQHVYGR